VVDGAATSSLIVLDLAVAIVAWLTGPSSKPVQVSKRARDLGSGLIAPVYTMANVYDGGAGC
jgi:hypothetical protein